MKLFEFQNLKRRSLYGDAENIPDNALHPSLPEQFNFEAEDEKVEVNLKDETLYEYSLEVQMDFPALFFSREGKRLGCRYIHKWIPSYI